jgi:hypothetical protein
MKLRCLIHSWHYVKSTDGSRNMFTGDRIKREDRFCRDCDKMQIKVSQFTPEQQTQLARLAKRCLRPEWLDFKDGNAIDKLTRKWLRMNS